MSELYEAEALDVLEASKETGQPLEHEEDLKIQEQEHAVLSHAHALELMVAQPGWKLLETWIDNYVDQYKEAIVFETDLERLVHFQEAIKAYRSCVNWVHGTIAEAEVVRKDSVTQNADNPDSGPAYKEN